MLQTQNGRCAICSSTIDEDGGKKTGAFVDHDHATGKIRALLCALCNCGIGMFRERHDLLHLAVAYLTRHQ